MSLLNPIIAYHNYSYFLKRSKEQNRNLWSNLVHRRSNTSLEVPKSFLPFISLNPRDNIPNPDPHASRKRNSHNVRTDFLILQSCRVRVRHPSFFNGVRSLFAHLSHCFHALFTLQNVPKNVKPSPIEKERVRSCNWIRPVSKITVSS
jgi:hypothetical protein